MTLFQITSLILCAIIILRALQNWLNLRKSLAWLKTPALESTVPSGLHFYVCIPALDEQHIITNTLRKFLAQDYPCDQLTIYVVTTAKETPITGKPSTREVVETFRAQLAPEQKAQIQLLHYPDASGHMAHQVNYAARHLDQELRAAEAYFVIYNADSGIAPDTFRKTAEYISRIHERRQQLPPLLQQSALYQYRGGTDIYARIAEGAGLHQTMWTLMHEIPRLLRQSSGTEKLGESQRKLDIIMNSRVAHCVGHGLFVRGDYYLQHPFFEGMLNEDLPYGLLACTMRQPIYPIPSLELASTPARTMAVYKQKSVWFNPFFEFYHYGKKLSRHRRGTALFELRLLVLQAYIPLLIWLVHSFVVVGGLIASLLAGPIYIALWLAVFAAYWVLPALLVTGVRHTLLNGGTNTYSSVFAGSLYVLTHSVGPLWAIVRWSRALILQIQPSKPKTEVL